MEENKNKFLLFDVDGTLTLPREKIEENMKKCLMNKKANGYILGAVGGGTVEHIKDQLEETINQFDYVFSENGCRSFKESVLINEIKIQDIIGNDALKEIINFSLKYMSKIHLPFKRGTFFELRTGLVNICPMGRNCSYDERLKFVDYDQKHNILKPFRDELEKLFSNKYNLVFSIGSSISIDMFIEGYRKPYCLQYIDEKYEIYFFGDKTSKGGNDYELSIHERIKKSFTVHNPEDTINILNEYFN